MNQVTLVVDQDISIVSIFDLQNIGNDWISSLTFDEILPGNLKIRWIFLAKFILKILIETAFVSFPKLISRNSILNTLDDPADVLACTRSIWDRFIRKNYQFQVSFFKDPTKKTNNLQC